MNRKEYIRREILKELCHRGRLTRVEFSRRTGLRAATVFEVIDKLKAEGVISELERKGKRTGRVSPVISLNADCLWLAGIDFQFKKTVGIIANLNGETIVSAEAPGLSRNGIDACCSEIRTLIRMLKKKAGADWAKVKGIGFADPGMVDMGKGVSLKAVNISGWENFNTSEWLRRETGIAAGLIVPETLAGTFMEYYSRFPNPPASMFRMNTGTGIGGGFIKDGSLFIGDSCRGMEIGHLVIQTDGPLCQCGNRGCLEAVAGESGILRRVEELIANGVSTELRIDKFSIGGFCEAARHDKNARMLAYDISARISNALCTVVTMLNPSLIVIGGELSKLGDILLQTINRDLSLYCLAGTADKLSVEISRLDEYAAAKGAALMVRERILLQSDPCKNAG
ncbi:MAG: ROK family transcriptional regulator [Victivallales bacterium]